MARKTVYQMFALLEESVHGQTPCPHKTKESISVNAFFGPLDASKAQPSSSQITILQVVVVVIVIYDN